ncbi:MAG TPA: DUF1003 domain-containing protein [Armatimonadota bacterium]|jgi:uncharacterized membrane protein
MADGIQLQRPPSLDEFQQGRGAVRDINAEHQERITPLERLAIFMSDHVGTPGFFFIIVLWTVGWLGWNLLAPAHLKFDPPMGFVFWLFISNMIQIFLMPLLMVAQNLQNRHAQLRAENDFQVNTKAEEEIVTLLQHLEYQNALLRALLVKNGIDLDDEPAEVSEGAAEA